MGIFRDIPNDVLADEQRQIAAADWAAQQRRQLADEWAQEQRRQIALTLPQGQPSGPEIGATTPDQSTVPYQSQPSGLSTSYPPSPSEMPPQDRWPVNPVLSAVTDVTTGLDQFGNQLALGGQGSLKVNPATGRLENTQPTVSTDWTDLVAKGKAAQAAGEPQIPLGTFLTSLGPGEIKAGLGLAREAAPVVGKAARYANEAVTSPEGQRLLRKATPGLGIEDVSGQEGKATGAVPPAGDLPAGAVPPAGGPSSLPTIKPTSEILGNAYNSDWMRKAVDKLDNPVTRTIGQALGEPKRDLVTQGRILHETIIGDWKSAVTGASARLRQLGTSDSLFNVDKQGFADIGGRKIAVNDVLEYPDRFALNPTQKQFVTTLHKLYDDQLLSLAAEGIDVKLLSFSEGGHYVGRKVLGKIGDDGTVEVAQVGSGARIGAKPGFEKSRTFATQEEALAKGFAYLSPEQALQMNLQAAGRQIADKRLADYVLQQIPYRKAQAPEDLIAARDVAHKGVRTVEKLTAVINRGYRGERVPPATIASIGKFFPEAAQGLLKANITKIESSMTAPIERAALQQVEAMVPTLKAQSQATYYKARSAASEALAEARESHYGESRIMSPAFQGKFFSAEDANKLRQMLNLNPTSPIQGTAQAVSWVNALPRVLMTTWDFGTSLIQGQMTLYSHPDVWAKAWGQSMKALVSEKGNQSFLATHADTIKNWSRDGAIFTPSEFTSAIQPGGVAEKIPGLRTVMKPFGRSFESFLNATRIYGLEATEKLAKTPEDRVGLAKFWNEMSGVVDTAKMGISPAQRDVETALLFAPRYRHAVLALMTDVAKGGIRGQMARDAVGKTMVAGLAGYMGVWAIANKIDPKGNPSPHLDPREGGKWLTIKIGGQNIGLGGTFYSTGRTLLQMAVNPGQAHITAAKYVKNALSPMVGTAIDAYQFPFRYDSLPKFSKEVVAGNLLPIWAQAWLLNNASAPAVAAETLGGRSFTDTPPKAPSSSGRRIPLPPRPMVPSYPGRRP